MEKIQVRTLIDVTPTGISRYQLSKELEHNQQKNWITLLQAIELRSLIEFDQPAVCETLDLRALGFGEKHRGTHAMWTFVFTIDRDFAYADEKSRVGLLMHDLHEVPIIRNLTETINMNRPVFDTQSRFYRNTVVKLL